MKSTEPSPKFAKQRPDFTADLFQTVAQLRSAEEVASFLRDLCTIPELQAISTRWQVARLLDSGVHYQAIAEQTGASTATISRVASWLHFGTGGYREMLARVPGPHASS